MARRRFLIFLLAGILIGLVVRQWYAGLNHSSNPKHATEEIITESEEAPVEVETTQASDQDEIPQKVFIILKYVQTFHQPKEGYVGGRTFHNFEKKLPQVNSKGKPIRYREWDVNPKKPLKPRGKERLVTGDDKSAWYTKDHYKTFKQIKNGR